MVEVEGSNPPLPTTKMHRIAVLFCCGDMQMKDITPPSENTKANAKRFSGDAFVRSALRLRRSVVSLRRVHNQSREAAHLLYT